MALDAEGLTIEQLVKLINGRVTATVAGTGTLIAGAATVSTTAITANSLVLLVDQGGGAHVGAIYEDKASRVAGTSFAVKSLNVLDTSDFGWLIVEPA